MHSSKPTGTSIHIYDSMNIRGRKWIIIIISKYDGNNRLFDDQSLFKLNKCDH